MSLVIGWPSSVWHCVDSLCSFLKGVIPPDPLLSFPWKTHHHHLVLFFFDSMLPTIFSPSNCVTQRSVSIPVLWFFLLRITQTPHKIALLLCVYSTSLSSLHQFAFQRQTADMLADAHTGWGRWMYGGWLHGQEPNDSAWFNCSHSTAFDTKNEQTLSQNPELSLLWWIRSGWLKHYAHMLDFF